MSRCGEALIIVITNVKYIAVWSICTTTLPFFLLFLNAFRSLTTVKEQSDIVAHDVPLFRHFKLLKQCFIILK